MLKIIILNILFTLIFLGCNSNNEIPSETLTYTFSNNSEGWEGNFTDYSKDNEEILELHFQHTTLPAILDINDGAMLLSGNNHSDDLFMYLSKKIENLEPNKIYNITFSIEFASNVADDQIGVGGSPGEGVTIKAGATSFKPERIVDEQNTYRMNIDKGNQTNGGKDMIVVGDFSNDTNQNIYTLKTVSNKEPFTVQSNANGEIWLIIGTDSGFEATTAIYYNTILISLIK